MRPMCVLVWACACLVVTGVVAAQPSVVEHVPGSQAFGQSAGVTQRQPATPREDEPVTLYFRVCCQGTYDRVAVYYTTGGAEPSGSFGSGALGTQVLSGGNPAGPVTFVSNEVVGGQTYDWWRVTLPGMTRFYQQTIKYKISAWRPFQGAEVFANGGASYSFSNKLAWPGAGAGQANPSAGYPPVSFWKEEAVFGNTYTAGQIDQNGTVYDMHFPTPGGVYGVGTHNEGYVDGGDTFPALLPAGWRGQMHLNQAMAGVRVGGVTHWLSNPGGVSYDQVSQSYVATSNTINTSQRLYVGGLDIQVQQTDFAPIGIAFPNNLAGQPERHIYVKRLVLTLPAAFGGSAALDANVYWYVDPALNGGDSYDAMFFDPAKGAMVAYDKETRTVHGTGTSFSPPEEYNPTTDAGYTKNIALYLGSCMKTAHDNGLATESWRDSSSDNGQGWIGKKVYLEPGVPVEVDIVMVGAFYRPPDPLTDPMPANDGVYDTKMSPVLDWFRTANMASVQSQTDAYWTNWLAGGTRAATPNPTLNRLMDRGLLATALHVDGVNGGVIAGFHNGAYPYVWPRDAVYAAITLARTGHLAEAEGVYAWMKNTAYRDFEPWGRRGFWKQKYSTDGYVIWGAPQIDETAVLPWGVAFQYQMTGDVGVLNRCVEQVRDAVQSCTRDSGDSRLYLVDAPGDPCSGDTPGLMHSNNVWEDSYATFVYSNSNIVRALRDSAAIFDALGLGPERDDALNKAAGITSELDARLACNSENTDISQLGGVYPFNAYAPTDPLIAPFVSRINAQLVNPTNAFNDGYGWTGLVNRYTGDGYWGNGSASSPWGAGPWFLSTMWLGLYDMERAAYTPGKADVDAHTQLLALLAQHLGPIGLGAEQIAPRGIPSMGPPWNTGSLLYPSQNDFTLQTAWPNAWESMSTFVDCVMAYLHYEPDAPSNTMRISPKLPSTWGNMTFSNVTLVNTPAGQTHKVDVSIAEGAGGAQTLTFTNRSGFPVNMRPTLKLPPGWSACGVTVNGSPQSSTPDVSGRLAINTFALATGAGAVTTLRVTTVAGSSPDWNHSGSASVQDIFDFLASWFAGAGDFNGTGGSTVQDIFDFLAAWFVGC